MAKLATATVYGPKGESDIATYDAFTMSSDYKTYGAIDNGMYNVYNTDRIGPLNTHFSVNNGTAVNCLEGKNPSPINPYSSTQKDAIWIHRSNRNGDMLPQKNGIYRPLSTGCLIIAPTQYDANGQIKKIGWDQFVKQIDNIKTFPLFLYRQQ